MLSKSDLDELEKYNFFHFSELKLYEKYLNSNNTINISQDLANLLHENTKITFNNFGNINLCNVLLFLIQIKQWIQNIIPRFELDMKLFVVKLYIQGKAKSVLIDDKVPIISEDDLIINNKKSNKNKKNQTFENYNPAFILHKDNPLILIIEKAVAKINRSYGNIIRCLASELFPMLTEIPMDIIIHNLNKKRKLWEIFKKAGDKNWILFSEFETMSLESFDAIKFLSYFVVNSFKINGVKYVELTIPENDKNIADIIKNKLQILPMNIDNNHPEFEKYFPEIKIKSNKIIYLPFDNFYEIFYRTCIIKYEPNYFYNFTKYQINNNGYNFVKLKINQKTKVFLTMHLKQTRFYIRVNNYDIPLSRMWITRLIMNEKYIKKSKKSGKSLKNQKFDKNLDKVDSNEFSYYEEDYDLIFEYIKSTYGKKEKHTLELELTEGVYYIFFKVYSELLSSIVLSTYSDNHIQFETNFDDIDSRIYKNKSLINYQSLNSFFSSFLESHGCVQNIENDMSLLYSHSLTECHFGYSLLKIENNSQDKIINLNLTYEINGMKLISHTNSNKSLKNTQLHKHFINLKDSITDSANI